MTTKAYMAITLVEVKIGFRQMAPLEAEYSNLKVYEVIKIKLHTLICYSN